MKFFSDRWRNPFAKIYSRQEQSIFRFLRKNSLFDTLLDDELADFIPHLYARSYRKDEVIFFRNDPSQALYLVKEGKVTLSLDIENRFEELILLEQHQNFGENTLIEGSLRRYNAISASEATEIYVIPQINIFEIFQENTNIKAQMMASLASQYEQYTQNLFANYRNSIGFIDLADAYYKKVK